MSVEVVVLNVFLPDLFEFTLKIVALFFESFQLNLQFKAQKDYASIAAIEVLRA